MADNNLKIATQTTDAEVTTVGLFVDAGARYEEAKNNGASNLLARMLFKGSAKRAQPELWNEVANLGGELKFDVTRDRIAIYDRLFIRIRSKICGNYLRFGFKSKNEY